MKPKSANELLYSEDENPFYGDEVLHVGEDYPEGAYNPKDYNKGKDHIMKGYHCQSGTRSDRVESGQVGDIFTMRADGRVRKGGITT